MFYESLSTPRLPEAKDNVAIRDDDKYSDEGIFEWEEEENVTVN